MIDWQKYNDTFQWYGKDVEIELIDVFNSEYSERIAKIEQNVQELDFEQLKFNTHSLKGTIGNYYDSDSTELAKTLEIMAKNGQSEGLSEVFFKLKEASGKLLIELLDHKSKLLESGE